MSNYVVQNGVQVMSGSKTYDLLQSKDPEDKKKAKRLIEFSFKAAKLFYKNPEYSELRKEFSDVL